MPLSQTLDDFEDGDLAGWTVNNWQVTSSTAYSGSNSAYENGTFSTYEMARRSFSDEVEEVELYYQCSSNSFGGAFDFEDGNGNRVTAVGNSNPNWMHMDGSSAVELSGGSYDTWTRVYLLFDYSAGTVDITFDEVGGTSTTVTANLITANPVTEIVVTNADDTQSLSDGDGSSFNNGNSDYYEWTDLISFAPLTPTTPQNVTATADGNDPDLSWDAVDWRGEQGHYNVYRGPVGGSLSQIAEVAAGTTTYNDTGASQDSEYDYAIEAENSSGTSSLSNRDSAVTLPTAPSDLSGSYTP